VTMDADGSADPGEIPRFLAALDLGVDFAKGRAFAPGGGSGDITRLRKAGNRVLTWLVNGCLGPIHRPLLRLQRFPSRLPQIPLRRCATGSRWRR